MSPQRVHKARAQGVSRAVFFSSSVFARASPGPNSVNPPPPSSSVASSEQLAPSSTVPETSATMTESVPASSAGLEQPAQPVTASALPEQTRTASPAPVASEGHSTSSASMADGSDDAARFEAVPRDSTAPPPPPSS